MKRVFVPALFAVLVLVMLVPPALAQAPAPKVTITGLFDQVTGVGKNFYDGNLARDNDREWYARTRFRPDFEFAVGRTKAVLGLEIDLGWGQMGANDGGFPANVTGSSNCKANTNGCFDLNTDVGGMIEIKWMYTEFDLTGKDSVLPFIPVGTVARAGAQPWATLANYKIVYANGDFAGVSTVTTILPNLKLSLAFAIVEDQLAGGNRALAQARTSRGEDYAFIVSPEFSPVKGFDLKPLYAYFHADGSTSSTARRNLANNRTAGGTTSNPAAVGTTTTAGDATLHEDRHTIGMDARFRIGPIGIDPSVYYQFGHRDTQAFRNNGSIGTVESDISAWLFDLIGSFRLGPLLLEGRGTYSPGNQARDNLAQSIRYYQPMSLDNNFYAGWTQFFAGGSVDYFNGGFFPQGRWVGYDRYGTIRFALKATYAITPALSVYGLVSPQWTAEKVDTDTGVVGASATANGGAGSLTRTTVSDRSFVEGDSRYIGTEVNLGLTWRFAPNVAFDLVGGWLAAGEANDIAECLGGAATTCAGGTVVKRSANDAYLAAMRVRLAF